MKKHMGMGMVLLFLAAAQTSWAQQQAIEALRKPVETVVGILRDPKYQDKTLQQEQNEKLWEVARGIFDFEAIARGTLKRYRWKQFSPEQRNRFTDVFTRFIAQNYFHKIQGSYQNEQVVFLHQDDMSPSKVRVKTVIHREAVEIPVDYSMWQRNGRWQIYNVYVEGVSLLGNYRNEFERFLNDHKPAELIEQLEEKLEAMQHSKG